MSNDLAVFMNIGNIGHFFPKNWYIAKNNHL